MANYKKPQGKNFVPREKTSRPSRPAAGSRSPGHRGYRPVEEGAPRKQRWDAEQRAARAAGRAEDGQERRGRAASAPGTRGGSRYPERSYPERSYDRARGERARGERAGDRAGSGRTGSRYQASSDDRGRADRAGQGTGWGRDAERDRRDGRGSYGARAGDRPRDTASGRGDDRPRRAARSDGYVPREVRGGGDARERRFSEPRGIRSDDRGGLRSDDGRGVRSGEAREGRAAASGSRYAGRDAGREVSYDRRPREDRSWREDRPREDRPRHDRPWEERGPRADRDYQGVRGSGHPDRRTAGRPARYSETSEAGAVHRFTPEDDVVLERLEARATVAADVDGVSFADLGLGGNIVRELAELGAASPFPIQAATIPDVLAGRDVLGRGRTGSGKTIAFGAPLVEKLMENGGGRKRSPGRLPRALILAPTRELALQIDRTVQPIARSVGLFTTQIYGGVPQHRQVVALQRGVDIVIGTPGRIEDLIEQGRLDLSEVIVTVLDEADHMCDLGFLEPVQRLLRLTAPGGQKLLFSATLDSGVAQLVDEFLQDPAVHEVAGEDQASSTIDHRVFIVDHRDKTAVIEQLASREGKTLIFSRTRAYAEQLSDLLEDAGIRSTSLHGDLNQSRRTRNLGLLTSGRVSVLVATDVAARGIHVDDIDLVIQADAPDEYKTYLHRAGRTGRAGKEGTVVTLIPKQRRRRMDDLLSRAEITAEFTPVIPGDESLSVL